MVEPEDAARLRLAVEAARDAAAKRRAALLAAESALPGAARRPEANYGERWEAEEALATVRGAAGASAARALGLAHPDAAHPGDDRAAPAPTAIPDPAERGVHDAPRRRSLRALEDPSEEEPPSAAAARATPFWVETIDGDTGAAYYFDPETRETRWDRPENARIVPDERAAATEAKPTHPSNGVAGTHPGTDQTGPGTDQTGPGTDHPSPDHPSPDHPSPDPPRWHYLDDAGTWRGPFTLATLRGWRDVLPASLRVFRAAFLRAEKEKEKAAAASEEAPPPRAVTRSEPSSSGGDPGGNGGGDRSGDGWSGDGWSGDGWSGDGSGDAPPLDGCDGSALDTTLASALGDAPALFVRAAAAGVEPHPRATAPQIEAAIEEALRVTRANERRDGLDGLDGLSATRLSDDATRVGGGNALEDAARRALGGIGSASLVANGLADPAELARAAVAHASRVRDVADPDDDREGGYRNHYLQTATFDRVSGRVVAKGSGSPRGDGGGGVGFGLSSVDAARSSAALYGGGPLGHHADASTMEAQLAEAKRARAKRAAADAETIRRARARKAERKRKKFDAWLGD